MFNEKDPFEVLAERYRQLHPTVLRAYEPTLGALHNLDYERYVEQPRRQGRDPMYEAMMAEAIAESQTATGKVA